LAVIRALLLLTAFAGAFLVGLVVVGFVVSIICGSDLLRRRLSRGHPQPALLTAK